jgi:hypothetical protein
MNNHTLQYNQIKEHHTKKICEKTHKISINNYYITFKIHYLRATPLPYEVSK